MADDVVAPGTGTNFATDDIGGRHFPRMKVTWGADGTANDTSTANPLPISDAGGSITVDGTVAISGTVPVSDGGGSITVDGTFWQATQPVSGPLTDAQLRAAAVPVSGPLTDGQLRATAVPVSGTFWQATQPVSAASLPLPTGAATEATLSDLNLKHPTMTNTVPLSLVNAPPVRPVGQDIWACSFANSGASLLSADFTTPIVGTGVTYNQTSGSLNVLTGTNTNAEFLTRSAVSWRGAMRMRASIVASQRIANQNLQITLADLIGSTLTYNIVNSTTVDVTLTAHSFTSLNVGQFINLGGITGAAGVPGRYAIASIPNGDTIRFTVAGWPASGTGTLTLFGWNYSRNLINGTTATQMAWDTQRRGWAAGDVTATINTTASPGTIIQNDLNGRDAFLLDQLRITSTTPTFAARASRYENLPDDDTVLYVWIWSYNGTSAPASTTTWTIGFISVEKFANQPVYIQGARANGAVNPIPVAFPSAQAVSGTVTANIGTGSLAAGTNAIGDVGVQYRATTTGAGTPTNVNSPATPAGQTIKGSAGRLLGFVITNSNVATRWLKVFNATAVTPGTTAALFEVALPPGQPIPIAFEGGMAFGTGIMIMVTGGQGLTNNTAITLGDVTGFTVHA